MGVPITGAFARANQTPLGYTGAGKWGNGVNPVHALYDGPPRPFGPGVPNDLDQRTSPAEAAPGLIEGPPDWGINPGDIAGLDVVYDQEQAVEGVPFDSDGWPSWDETVPETRAQVTPMYPSWNMSGRFIRSISQSPTDRTGSFQTPGETVSEGWINKATGQVSVSHPADDSQVFVQTSDVQRFKAQDNHRAQMRGTDDARQPISSRVMGKIVKVYSGEERHYDMFPRQIDDIPRPFYYRTAATGPHEYNEANDFRIRSPLQRTPPPDPSMGLVDTELGNTADYGYSDEDWSY